MQFDLPIMESGKGAMQAAGAIEPAVAQEELTPLDGASVISLVENYRTLETKMERHMAEFERGVRCCTIRAALFV